MLTTALVACAGSPPPHPALLPAEVPLTAYRITYRVTTANAPDSEDERIVSRPYLGRAVSITGSTIGSGELTNDEGEWHWFNGAWTLTSPGHHRAAGDDELTAALDYALAHHEATIIGPGNALSRPCVVVRTSGPVGDRLATPTRTTHADICVDGTGVPLTEVWTLDGKVVRSRTATTFDIAPTLGADAFAPDPRGPPLSPQGGSIPISAVATPDELAQLPAHLAHPPPGFTEDGGYVTVPTQAGQPSGPATYTEHFVAGTRLIDVEQSHLLDSTAAPLGTPVHVALGPAGLMVDLEGSALEVHLRGDAYVILRGPDPALLLTAAAGLVATG